MQDRIEPPVLLSRLLIFVFAAMLVVLGAMVGTLYCMYPLDRPQVFFLMSAPKNDLEVVLREMAPINENMNRYKRSFIREYIKARNEIIPNVREMRQKWTNDANGAVYTWSSPDVYNAFTQTGMWNLWMSAVPDFDFSCSVEFENGAIAPRGNDVWAVTFQYFCSDIDRQTDKKEYTIRIKLDAPSDATIKWDERFNNPLGIRVSEYVVESGNGDPLDTGYLETDGAVQ